MEPLDFKTELSLSELKYLLSYDKNTGYFTWKNHENVHRKTRGKIAGATSNGYIKIKINKVPYLAHRLAWFYCFNVWPSIIDHIDGDRSNNSILNLREATKSQNGANSTIRKDNKSGLKGVSYEEKRNKFVAAIRVNGKDYKLGRFVNSDDAAKAYEMAAKKHFGEFAKY